MQIFNNRTIKKYKGRLIQLNYLYKGMKDMDHHPVGEIVSSDRDGVTFNVNKSKREDLKLIRVLYEHIESISKPEKV